MNTRNAVRCILINDAAKVLLMQVELPGVKRMDGPRHHQMYWITVGGKVEPGETPQETARREIKEETGFTDVDVGKIIGYETFELIVKDQLTRYNNTYVVAYTKGTELSAEHWTDKEKGYVKQMRWFSVEDIQENMKDIHPINPNLAAVYLPRFLRGTIPVIPIRLDEPL